MQNIKAYCLPPTDKSELELLNLVSSIYDRKISASMTLSNWKDKNIFRPLLESDLKTSKDNKFIIMIDAQSLKMMHTHFKYKDLIKDLDLIMTVYSDPKNLIWTYNTKQLKWNESPLKKIDLFCNKLETAIRMAQTTQTEKRFSHTVRVLDTVWRILNLLEVPKDIRKKVLIASAYHDLAKNWTLEQLKKVYLKRCSKSLDCPDWALHGPVAAAYLQHNQLVKDKSILRAVQKHTIPPKRFNIIGKILVIADRLEPHKKENFTEEIYSSLWENLKNKNINFTYQFLRENPKK